MPPARRSVIAAWAVALLLTFSVRATAQKSAFIDAFVDFHSALLGIYGDEGPQVVAALDRMTASLDAWERSNRGAEAALRSRVSTTPADIAVLYADEQRLNDAIDAMRLAIAAEPRRAPYHVFQGLLHQAAGHPMEASAAFRRHTPSSLLIRSPPIWWRRTWQTRAAGATSRRSSPR